VAIVFSPISEIQALFVAAVVNGTIAPVILVFVMVTAHDRRILGNFTPGRTLLRAGLGNDGRDGPRSDRAPGHARLNTRRNPAMAPLPQARYLSLQGGLAPRW